MLQILVIPFAIIGVILVAYRQIGGSGNSGVSSTAITIINGRWTMDVFGIRHNQATVALHHGLPTTSVLGLWLVLFPLYVRYNISGKNWRYPTVAARGEESIANLVVNRTRYGDAIIATAKEQVEQFVVMGAGFDTRCYGTLKQSDLTMFELDKPRRNTFTADEGARISETYFMGATTKNGI